MNLNNANIVPEAIHSHSPLQFPKRQVKQWWVLVCPLPQDESEKYLIAPTEIIIMGAFNVLDDRPSLSVSLPVCICVQIEKPSVFGGKNENETGCRQRTWFPTMSKKNKNKKHQRESHPHSDVFHREEIVTQS